MATPILTNVPSVISLAESVTGWTGDTFSLEPDIKVQGGNSVACSLTTNGQNQIAYQGGAWNMTGTHIRLWLNTSIVGNLDIEANGGIEIYAESATNSWSAWTVGGSDTYAGGWQQFVVDVTATPDRSAGTLNLAAVNEVGFYLNTTSKPRNVPANTWADAWYFGNGYTVTGGTSGDPITWEGIAAVDQVEAYNIASEQDGVVFLAGDVTIGSGATATYLQDESKVQFRDFNVNASLYRIGVEGSGCELNASGGIYGAPNTQNFTFDCSDATATVDILGKQFSNADFVDFSAGQDITNCVFDGCNQIDPKTSLFQNNTISNYIGGSGGVLFPSDGSNFKNCTFINNDNSIEYGSGSDATTPILDGMFFDDVAGKYDINNTSGAAVTLNISNGGNANSFNPAGDTVTFENPKTFKFTLSPSITSYEWRIYTVTAAGSLAGSVEIAGEEVATQDNQTYAYNYTGDQSIAVQILPQPNNDYEEKIVYETLTDSNKDIGITINPDNNN